MSIQEFIKKKFSALGIVKALGGYITILSGLHLVFGWLVEGDQDGAVLWASSMALGLFMLVGVLEYCIFAQMKKQEEIDRMAENKKRLESAILKNRQSSGKGGI